MKLKKYNVVYGHYGTGKTSFCLNMALSLAEKGHKVSLVDLDIVNPYFRSSDYTNMLKDAGVNLVSPKYANTTLEAPALSANINSVFNADDSYVFFDVGGDDAGAYAIGQYSDKITNSDSWQSLYVINKFREQVSMIGDALSTMRSIETASHIPVSGIINNSHISSFTTAEDIISGYGYAKEFSKTSNLPLLASTVPASLYEELKDSIKNIIPFKVLVNLPWSERF